jgi:hypothetical protein
MIHRDHQLVGVDQLFKLVDLGRTATWAGVTYRREVPGCFFIADEVGAGKTKQCVDTGQLLFLAREIDTIVTLTPGFARSTWADPDEEIGEVAKHCWANVPNIVHEYHGSYADLDLAPRALHWIVSNYEFIREKPRLEHLIKLLKGRKTWLIVDESWAVKGNSNQTKAVLKLRNKRASRVTLLNGTPLADGKPSDLYYQFKILDESIIGCPTRAHFKAKHCVMLQGTNRVVDYQNLDELNARIAPYVLSRRTRDCFDLPPMLPPVTVEAKLSAPNWKLYCEQRDDMVTFLKNEVSITKNALNKAMRLSQICSGFLGGLEEASAPAVTGIAAPMPAWLRKQQGLPYEDPSVHSQANPSATADLAGPTERVTREVGREKLDAFLFWLTTAQRQPDKLIVWTCFTPELQRLAKELAQVYPSVLQLRGGQTPEERRITKLALAPGAKGRAAVVGNTGAGGASLNFSAANIMVFMSNDVALIKRTQAIGRIERPGATQPMLIVDVVATGPKGQKTVDHHTIKRLRNKQDMATLTVAQWRAILEEE